MTSDLDALFDEASPSRVQKRKKAKSKQVFKPYTQHQVMLLPPSLEELIPENHLVRVVNRTVEKLNIQPLLATYQGDGASAYHPLMLLKVLIYAYLTKTYSSRLIAKALAENIHFMWLSGMSTPDFRTINNFRSSRLRAVIDQVFGSMVFFLLAHGYVDLEAYFVDGTKLRADSNKHKVVWAKNTKRYKQKVQQKINDLLVEIEQANAKEQEHYGERNLEELGEQSTLTSNSVKEQVDRLNEILRQATPEAQPPSPTNKRTARALNKISMKLLPKLQHYEHQEETLAGRNSYARTDPDATVFLSKDGQLLPSYNLLIGTQHQFLVNYSLHQRRASESDAFPAHLRRLHSLVGRHPDLVMGDSAFGSEENYALLSEHQIGNYLKYNTFHLEQKRKYRNNPYRKENFPHDAINDTYHCPQGRVLTLKQVRTVASTNGYNSTARSYQCSNCHDCPVATQCKRGDGNRTIYINPTLDRYRVQVRTNLNSDVGIALRKQRGMDVEPPFGDLKFNQGYTRCRLRGLEKVNVEIAILSIAHNIKKVAYWVN